MAARKNKSPAQYGGLQTDRFINKEENLKT